MISFLADENFNNDIVRGVRRRRSDTVIIRAQDVGLSGCDDPTLLDWCAKNNLAVLTHDVSTMTLHAYERVEAGKDMPGVFEVSRAISVGAAIEDILLLAVYSLENEWQGRVVFLPLQ